MLIATCGLALFAFTTAAEPPTAPASPVVQPAQPPAAPSPAVPSPAAPSQGASTSAASTGAIVETVEPPSAQATPVRLLRVVVQDVRGEGINERLGSYFTASLVAEVRKLDRTTVVGMDELRALLRHEADRQLSGCEGDSCLADIADALGADVVVTAGLARVGADSVINVRRLDAKTAQVVGFDKRVIAGNGEEFLAEIGPAIEKLFSDRSLRPGESRGVDREVGLRLNPPPVHRLVFYSLVGGAGVAAGAGVGAGLFAGLFEARAQDKVDASVRVPARAADVGRDYNTAIVSSWIANGAFVAAGGLAIAAGASAMFTDFEGYGDAQ
jgi:hypothetical protein